MNGLHRLQTPMDRQQFLNLCDEASEHVGAAEDRLGAWLDSITIAYANAYSDHQHFLADLGAKVNLPYEILLQAALAFLPGMAGGLLGQVMKTPPALLQRNAPWVAKTMTALKDGRPILHTALSDGAKDLTKVAFRSPEIMGLVIPVKLPLDDAFKPYPDNPLQWQCQNDMRIKTELGSVREMILRWRHSVNKNDGRCHRDFDPAKRVKNILKVQAGPNDWTQNAGNPLFGPYAHKFGKPLFGAYNGPPIAHTGPSQTIDAIKLRPVDQHSWSTVYEIGFLVTWIRVGALPAYRRTFPGFWDNPFGGIRRNIIHYGERLGLRKDFLASSIDPIIDSYEEENSREGLREMEKRRNKEREFGPPRP